MNCKEQNWNFPVPLPSVPLCRIFLDQLVQPFLIGYNPVGIDCIFRRNHPPQLYKKTGNIFYSNGFSGFSQNLFSPAVTSADKEGKGRFRAVRRLFDGTPQADASSLMRAAGGRAAGNMNLRKNAVREVFLPDRLHAVPQ